MWKRWKKRTKWNTHKGKRRDKGEKEEKKRREKRGWNPGSGKILFPHHDARMFGVADAASEDNQNKGRRME